MLEVSTVPLNQSGLTRRITLVVVNWNLHLVSEIHLLSSGMRGKI